MSTFSSVGYEKAAEADQRPFPAIT